MNKIERSQVQSSTIKSIGYDPESKTMEVEFKNGGAWKYEDVGQQAWDDFRGSSSIGKHFHANIRGKFKSTKL